MRWNTEDCFGNPVTYYKGELVDEIKRLTEELIDKYPESIELSGKILKLIESEE